MTRSETADIKKGLYAIVSLILGYYTYEIFLGYFRICVVLGFLGVIIGPFAFVDWLIDFKRRRRRKSKKTHRRIARILCTVLLFGLLSFDVQK